MSQSTYKIERLEPNLVLFDFDGTLTFDDTWMPFIKLLLPWRRRIKIWKQIFFQYIQYKIGNLPASKLRALVVQLAMTRMSATKVRQLGRIYATRYLPRSVKAEVFNQLLAHIKQGDRVVIVSAGLDVYLKPWCASLGIECLCTELEVDWKGDLTGGYVGEDCSGEEKAKRIKARIKLDNYPLIMAHGDTLEDKPMLNLADMGTFKGQPFSNEPKPPEQLLALTQTAQEETQEEAQEEH
jgi:phosphatidylglycerophosphatase C